MIIPLATAASLFFDTGWHLQHSPTGTKETQEIMISMIAFLKGQADTPAGLSEAEANHMHDVRSALQQGIIAWYALLMMLLVVLVLALTGTRSAETLRKIAVGTGASGMILLGIAALVQFEWLFTGVHQFLFVEGTWVFPQDSAIIALYPLDFFKAAAQRIAVESGAVFTLVLALPFIFSRR